MMNTKGLSELKWRFALSKISKLVDIKVATGRDGSHSNNQMF